MFHTSGIQVTQTWNLGPCTCSSGPIHTFLPFLCIFLATPSVLLCMMDLLAQVHEPVVDRSVYKAGQTLLCCGSNILLSNSQKNRTCECGPISSLVMWHWCDTWRWWQWNEMWHFDSDVWYYSVTQDLGCPQEFEHWEGRKIQLSSFCLDDYIGRFFIPGRDIFHIGKQLQV